MQLAIGNWTLEKAADGHTDKTARVRMVANSLQPDKEDQEIVAKAFDAGTVKRFLQDGHIDYFHKSVTGADIHERAVAILGKPVSFSWENNLPVVYADLTKANPIVRDAVLPHLEAANNVLGSSVGGNVLGKAKRVWNKTKKSMIDVIENIHWDHLAIAPRSGVISRGTEISLIKAKGDDAVFCDFSDMGAFAEEYAGIVGHETEFFKALTVSAGTDSAALTGVDALRKQSLEGATKSLVFSDGLVRRFFKALKNGVVSKKKSDIINFFRGENYSPGDSEIMTERMMRTIEANI